MALPQRVIVTGAAQGIGRAVALHVASPGVHLAVWDVKRDGVEETAKLCHEKGAAARAWPSMSAMPMQSRPRRPASSGPGASLTASSTTPEFFLARGRST